MVETSSHGVEAISDLGALHAHIEALSEDSHPEDFFTTLDALSALAENPKNDFHGVADLIKTFDVKVCAFAKRGGMCQFLPALLQRIERDWERKRARRDLRKNVPTVTAVELTPKIPGFRSRMLKLLNYVFRDNSAAPSESDDTEQPA